MKNTARQHKVIQMSESVPSNEHTSLLAGIMGSAPSSLPAINYGQPVTYRTRATLTDCNGPKNLQTAMGFYNIDCNGDFKNQIKATKISKEIKAEVMLIY